MELLRLLHNTHILQLQYKIFALIVLLDNKKLLTLQIFAVQQQTIALLHNNNNDCARQVIV